MMLGNSHGNEYVDLPIFILDSGSSEHVVNCPKLAMQFELLRDPIQLGVAKGGQYITATRSGRLDLLSDGATLVLENVLFVKEASANILSVSKLIRREYSIR